MKTIPECQAMIEADPEGVGSAAALLQRVLSIESMLSTLGAPAASAKISTPVETIPVTTTNPPVTS